MKFVILLFLPLLLLANRLEICYVDEDYKRVETFFGHIFLAYGDRAASFNLDSNMDIASNFKALFGTKAIFEILERDKLIGFYRKDNRNVTCYDINVSDIELANISAFFYEEDKYDTYTFLHKNCASALSEYAKQYNVYLKNSLVPAKFVSLNTDKKQNFSNIGIYYLYENNVNRIDFRLRFLEMNHKFSHKLSLFTFNKDLFSLIDLAEYNKFSYELDLGYKFKKNHLYTNFFLGYEYKGFFVGINNYGLNGGYIYNNDNFGLKLSVDKNNLKFLAYKDYKNLRFELITNKKFAKIGVLYMF
ncbi:DUF4105 domain-containing protein [Campylobacter sp. MG1]|uniref:lipoprotein N-acyltransferase Lnb domain-containing protein n=1 Tax=Campylobacter sp. MG1 TaxID=2976332 RepID=UPI00226CA64F|nr:DUF4105 domain-containing protein [Campylobacter sp. MG1]